MLTVGKFKVDSGKLVVSDPCYTRDTWCMGVVDKVLNGDWRAYVQREEVSGWGERCKTLVALHGSQNVMGTILGKWERCEFEVGVDSGQAGIFDDSFYPNGEDNGEYGDKESFYGKCCDLTLDTADDCGIVEGRGVVTSSGFGDGGYDAYVLRDKDGLAIGVKVIFITDEDMEDED